MLGHPGREQLLYDLKSLFYCEVQNENLLYTYSLLVIHINIKIFLYIGKHIKVFGKKVFNMKPNCLMFCRKLVEVKLIFLEAKLISTPNPDQNESISESTVGLSGRHFHNESKTNYKILRHFHEDRLSILITRC